MSLIYTVFNTIFHFEDGYAQFSGNEDKVTLSISQWIQENYDYANIIMVIFIAGWGLLLLYFVTQEWQIK
ncbi:hypothetical protein SAMN05660903_02899 [Salegentibacter salinarum]|nr:hypothetical protein SAMN05660903_02899 [Salegentibacter salinarum]